MTTFTQFRDALNQRAEELFAKSEFVFQSLIEKDVQWDAYMNAYPEGTNLIYRERPEHDCQTCKRFVRNVGRMLFIVDGKVVSIFRDLPIEGHYKVVADKLADLNEEAGISNIYLNDEQKVGLMESSEVRENGEVHIWNHFCQVLPAKAYSTRGDIGSRKSDHQNGAKVLKRSITEIDAGSVELVLELIDTDNLPRGGEMKPIVTGLIQLQREYEKAEDKAVFIWEKTCKMIANGHNPNIRGTSIGTLLVDLSAGTDIEDAVAKYDAKVGEGYKRTSKVVTPRMKADAVNAIRELGAEPSLARRNAVKRDVSINDVLFVNNGITSALKESSVFDAMTTTSAAKDPRNLKGVQDISAEDFIKNVLPSSKEVELFVENRHENNFVNLITAVHPEAPCIMKWGNNTSWNFNGENAVSATTQRVSKAGGCVDSDLRVSMSWDHRDDLDLHVHNSYDQHIYYGSYCYGSVSKDTGQLDVDMRGERHDQVENIFWTDTSRLKRNSVMPIKVHNFWANSNRNIDPPRVEGFTIEVAAFGQITTIHYNKKLGNKGRVTVGNIIVDKNGNITVESLLDSSTSAGASREIWGIETGDFRPVEMVMRSPNFWDNAKKVGNEHLFFMLKDCRNPDDSRGFYNEFLIQDFQPYRKQFEVLTTNMKAQYSEEQLAGLGFAKSVRNEVKVRVTSEVSKRVFNIKF
ncbi:hypothetical protein [Vibrio phage RYC]|nr:hypothetical protein [Vibrio phage RYC]